MLDPNLRKAGQWKDPEVPGERTLPEHKVLRVYARNGYVCVVGLVGEKEKTDILTIREAITRARALSEMCQNMKYRDEVRKVQNIIEQFREAVMQAKAQIGESYKSASIKIASELLPRKA